MKFFFSLLLCFLITVPSIAQVNLVPNPSFEDTLFCPTQANQIISCSNWINLLNTPDYFNSCNLGPVNVPNSIFGYQDAHSGNGRIGLVTYALPGLPGGPNGREFIGTTLTSAMVIGQKYYFSFYVNCGWLDHQQVATNKQGLKFSVNPYNLSNPPGLDNFAHLYSDSVITDTLNWIKFSGSFIADSAYSFVMLGNFFDDNHTDTLNLQPSPWAAYYYYDDICITTDSIYNEVWTGIENPFFNQYPIIASPNPTNGCIKISNIPNNITKISIINSTGKLCFSKTIFNLKESIFDLSFFPNGIYLIYFDNNIYLKPLKIIVITKKNRI